MNHRSIFATLLACVALSLGAAACAKPKDDDCKNAIANIRNLYGTANYAQGTPPQAAVRSCRGNASREAVQCITKAKTIQELESCAGGEFLEAMKGESATQPQEAPAQPQPAQPAQPQLAPAQQPPAQDPAQPPAQQDPAQQPAQPTQAPAQQPPAQPQDPAENPGQPAAPGQQPPAQ